MNTWHRAMLGCAILLMITLRPVQASVMPAWSIDQLTAFSSAVVTGRVVDLSVGRDLVTQAIYTYVTISVDDVLKGLLPERTIVVKQLGGTIGDEQFRVFDQAAFALGEEVLLFLEVRPRDGTLYTSALWQGKWVIEPVAAGGGRVAVRYAPDVLERGVFKGEPERRTLAPLANGVRARSSTDAPRGVMRSFRAAPPAEELAAASRLPAGSSEPFVLMETPYRWNEFDSRTAIPVDVMVGGQPGLSGGGAAEITRSFNLWSAATPLSFVGGGSTTRCFGTNSADGHISILFMDPCGEMADNSGILAAAGSSSTSSGGRTVNGTSYNRATAGYLINNNDATVQRWLTNSACFQAVETHEMGHILGLGHSLDTNAIMYYQLSSSCLSSARSLGSDDVAGIQSMYPSSATTPSVPGAPGTFTTSAVGTTVTMAWRAPTTGGTPATYYIESGSSSGLSNLANFSTGSTATAFSADRVGLGTYYVRVRAANAAGLGPASNESILVVGGSSPLPAVPGAPTSFVTSALGTTITMTWRAPTTGGTPTVYYIASGSAPGLSDLAYFSTGSNATSFSADRVGLGTYYVRVRAANAAGAGAESNESILVVGSNPNQPGAPEAFAATAVGTSVTMSWRAPQTGSVPTSYVIESGSSSGLSDIALIPIGSAATSFAASAVGHGTYFVRVRAVNAFGTGPASNEAILVVR